MADAAEITKAATTAAATTPASAVLAACRAALVEGPAASRAAFTKHQASIDSVLYQALEVVGSYDLEVVTAHNYFKKKRKSSALLLSYAHTKWHTTKLFKIHRNVLVLLLPSSSTVDIVLI